MEQLVRDVESAILLLESLDEIISKGPTAQLTGVRSQLMQADTLLQICFLEDVLTIANIVTCLTIRPQGIWCNP